MTVIDIETDIDVKSIGVRDTATRFRDQIGSAASTTVIIFDIIRNDLPGSSMPDTFGKKGPLSDRHRQIESFGLSVNLPATVYGLGLEATVIPSALSKETSDGVGLPAWLLRVYGTAVILLIVGILSILVAYMFSIPWLGTLSGVILSIGLASLAWTLAKGKSLGVK